MGSALRDLRSGSRRVAGLRFETLDITGAVLIRADPSADERGSFARVFDAGAFAVEGLPIRVVQESVSRNARKGTLRGLHGTVADRPEAKYVSCSRGRIFDVIVDARRESETFGRWRSFELSEERDESLFIPAGCLHGFQTLTDATVVHYRMDAAFAADAFHGRHYASPGLAIDWPLPIAIVSERDATLPPFEL